MQKPHLPATAATAKASVADLDGLLRATSRTFALAIPLLPSPERVDVTIGYLVFRIADTLEDADNLTRDQRIAALGDLSTTLGSHSLGHAQRFTDAWAPRRPLDNDDYQRLLEHTPTVLAALGERPPAVRQIVIEDARRSIAGMRATLGRASERGELRCGSVQELRDYCYHVAGIVGEMLTRLFRLRVDHPRAGVLLEDNARWFGEGLQLVNILKDADCDAEAGRTYLPTGAPRETVFALAEEDLYHAGRYIDALREAGAPAGFIAFCRAPHEMALATLAKLRADGPGAKITRSQVAAILAAVQADKPVEARVGRAC